MHACEPEPRWQTRAVIAALSQGGYSIPVEIQHQQPEASGGAALIAAERQRQISDEGWTSDHDAQHPGGELAAAATCYATPAEARPGTGPPGNWPWSPSCWKPCPDDRIRELVKAGALIAAEIDRLQATPSLQRGLAP